MTIYQSHGPLNCSQCFVDCKTPEVANGWRLVNDPGYWGASDPVVLVLGQSKGNKQRKVFAQGDAAFDAVAFAGIRDRLAKILDKISIRLDKADVDKHFRASETEVGFASLLRCSVSDPTGNTSGSPIIGAMKDPDADKWIENCMRKWLSEFNPRLKLVVLCGLTDAYKNRVTAHLSKLHANTFRKIDKFASEAAGVVWLFIQHPSTISENHYQSWIGTAPHLKRDEARMHLERTLSVGEA